MTEQPPPAFTLLMAVCGADEPRLFERAVDSIFANEILPDAFRLVVDGPVPPALDAVITKLQGSYPIEVQRLPENLGLGPAMNAGLSEVQTDWVARADADDFNLPNRFALQAAAMTDDFDIVGGVIREVDRDGAPIALRRVPQTDAEIRRQVSTRSPFNHPTVAFRKQMVLDCGGYPSLPSKQDYVLFAVLLKHGARARNLPDVLVESLAGQDLYRRRGGLRYAWLEVAVQRELVRCGFKSWGTAILHGSSRALVFLLPTALRGWIYRRFLRSR